MTHPWWSWPIAPREAVAPAGFTPLYPPRLKGDPSPPFKGKKFRKAAKRERKNAARRERRRERGAFRSRLLDVARITFASIE